jgi:ankyrin repeat protein
VDIVRALPIVLTTTDSSLQTPLHIALERQSFPEIIQTFLDCNSACLGMTDRQGDTPLLKAARGDYDISYLRLLLQYDLQHTTALIESKRKRRLPVWYIASNDLQLIHSGYQELPENLRLILLETYFALERKQGILGDNDTEWIAHLKELRDVPSSTTRGAYGQSVHYNNDKEEQLCLVLRAFVACIDLLGKYSVKVLEFLLERQAYQRIITAQAIDETGNFLLHQLCGHTTAEQPEEGTLSILLEHVLRHTHAGIDVCNAHGNSPLHLAVQADNQSLVCQLLPLCVDALYQTNVYGELPLHISIKRSNLSLSMELWKNYPTASQVIDGPTQLCPFQLAALNAVGASKKHSTDETKCENDSDDDEVLRWMSFIYDLLLAAPQVLGVQVYVNESL